MKRLLYSLTLRKQGEPSGLADARVSIIEVKIVLNRFSRHTHAQPSLTMAQN